VHLGHSPEKIDATVRNKVLYADDAVTRLTAAP
jgi:hypothetical protein